MSTELKSSLKIVLLYALFASLWIMFSDLVVEMMFSDVRVLSKVQTLKGQLFVVITSVLLLFLVYRDNKRITQVFQLDGLTGLNSHYMVKKSLERHIAELKPGQRIIIGCLSINKFREVNAVYGYDKADQLLLALSSAFKEHASPDSMLARLPPSQFMSVRLYDSVDDFDTEERVESFKVLFDQTAAKLGVDATCSIGVAFYPDDGLTAKTLLAAATEAAKFAKRDGVSIQYHDKDFADRANKRRIMLQDLKMAIQEQQLSLVYQPKYKITDEGCRVCGLEILIRWLHPEKGFISPAEFIPLAEEYHLSNKVSAFVVRQAEQELSDYGLLGSDIQHVAMNVSAAEFNAPQQMDILLQEIQKHPGMAEYCQIEITETATLSDMEKSAELIQTFRRHGIGISIDDFGTGYTSLAMLKDFAVDEIKIDRSFTMGLEDDDRSRTIVSAIIGMANNFAINVVAEGVETQEQMNILRDMGCKELQGFLLGRPMAVADLSKHLSGE